MVAWGDNTYGQTNVPASLTNTLAISAQDSSLALNADGTVTGWGGFGGEARNVPASLTNAIAIDVGGHHGLAIRTDGSIAAWGNNLYGQLSASGHAVAIAASYDNSFAVRPDGSIAAWGWNVNGIMLIPSAPIPFVSISSSYEHALALKTDGTISAWGWNYHGQCNIPAGLTNVVAVAAGFGHSLALKADGTVMAWGMNVHGECNVPADLTNAIAIAAGWRHSLALRADGTVAAWGANDYGQLNIPAGLTNVVVISGGESHSVALVGEAAPKVVQQPANAEVLGGDTTIFRVAATGLGTLGYQWKYNGTNLPGANLPWLVLTNIYASQAGSYSVVVSNYAGSVESSNALLIVHPVYFQQPTGGTAFGGDNVTFYPYIYGAASTFQWRFNGTNLPPPGGTDQFMTLYDVTTNSIGNYSVVISNIYGSVTSSNAFLDVIPLAINTQPANRTIYAGETASFGPLSLQAHGPWTYQWRFNGADLLDETNAVLTISNALASQAGNYSVLVSNPYGSLESSNGILTVVDVPPFIVSQSTNRIVSANSDVTFQITAQGSKPLLYQWRFNGTNLPDATNSTLALNHVAPGRMGIYDVTVTNALGGLVSTQIVLTVLPVIGWGANGDGQINPPLGTTNAVAVAAGFNHSVALKADGTVIAWGRGPSGQTNTVADLTNAVALVTGANQNYALRADGRITGWGLNTSGQLNQPAGLSNVVAFAAGWNHVLALKADATITAWGYNAYNQATVPAGLSNVIAVTAGQYHSAALKADGTVLAWGDNTYGQTNVPPGLSDVVGIVAGASNTVALKSDGSLVTWGSGTATNLTAAMNNAALLASGYFHGLAVKPDATVTAWGLNTSGQGNVPGNLTDAAGIAAGGAHSLALVGEGPPRVVQPPLSLTVLAESSVLFAGGATGPLPLSYHWNFNGADTGVAGRTLLLTNVQLSQSGLYSFTVSNALGGVQSSNAVLTVVPALFTTQPTNRSVYVGDSTVFTLAVQGPGTLTYQWQFNGTDIGGETNTTLTLSNLLASQTGNYRLVVSNSYGVVISSNAYLSVVDSAPFFLTQPVKAKTWVGGPATFSGSGNGSKPLRYQWRLNGVEVPGATNPVLTLANALTNQAGNYTLTLSNAVSSLTSTQAALTVQSLWAWGDDYYNKAPTNVPPALGDVTAAAGGYYGMMALRTDGRVMAWFGGNSGVYSSGETNVPANLSNVVAIAAGDYHNVALTSNGTVSVWGSNNYGQTNVPTGLNNVVGVAAGNSHVLALKSDGRIIGWGYNGSGQLNMPTGLVNVAAVAARGNFSAALKADGTVSIWGISPGAVPAAASNVVAMVAGYSHVLALRADGKVVAWGNNGNGQTTVPINLSNVVAVAAGLYHSIALKADGSLVMWGQSSSGQLNMPIGMTNIVGIADGGGAYNGYTVVILRTNDPAIARQPASFGGVYGQPAWLSVGAVSRQPLTFQWRFNGADLPGETNANLKIAALGFGHAGDYQVVASNSLGSVTSSVARVTVNRHYLYAWGRNLETQTNVPPDLNTLLAVAAGGYHNLALKADGKVVAWGMNTYGQTNVPANVSNIIAIAAGTYHSLALRSNGTVIAWGRNDNNQTNVPSDLTNVVAITAGANHNLALKNDGTIAAWGRTNEGQCKLPAGLKNVLAVAGGLYHSLALRNDGTVIAWGQNNSLQTNVPPTATGIMAIAAGDEFNLALKTNGTVIAWGKNLNGQTSIPGGLSGVTAIGCGSTHSFALKTNGTLVAWGNNGSGQITFPAGISNWVSIAGGFGHSLALFDTADPAIVRNSQPAFGVSGHPLLLSAAARSQRPLSYQWQLNGANIAGATNSWLLFSPLASQSGNYSVIFSNTLGQTVSQPATVIIVDQAPVLLTQPANQTNLGGASATFQILADGSWPLAYQWYKAGNPLLVETNSALLLTNLHRADEGEYFVSVSNLAGTTNTDHATLRVLVPQLLQPPTLNPDGSMSFSFNDSDGGMLTANDAVRFSLGASTNLVNWTTLTNVPFFSENKLWFRDDAATNWPQRYYRIIESP